MVKKYYLFQGGQQFGPLEPEELKNHEIAPSSLIWYDGLVNWLRADELEELKFLFISTAVPPPVPPVPPPVPPVLPPVTPVPPPYQHQFTRHEAVSNQKVIKPLSAFEWFSLCWIKALDFKGRARRSEFWYFVLVNNGIYLFIVILSSALGQSAFAQAPSGTDSFSSLIGMIIMLYLLISTLPFLAAGARRMHDVGKSGWFLIIPVYGFILSITEGEKGMNQYGKDPKQM